ncbi:MAG: DNA-directed RNA polymerase subunit alpha [bacterium]|nr:DNA-directed RNA polymerase subunit alpha [bacterium]
MEYQYLSETVGIKKVSETDKEGVFEIEGLYSGYGLTLGNALRRVLLSSLPGAAITQVKIKGASHEFSTVEGVKEDMVEVALNLKKVRFRIHTDEPQVLILKIKGEKVVTASDIKTNSQVDLISSDVHIATLTSKDAELDMEITVEKGLGYLPVESRKSDKLPIGVIAIDALFSPVVQVNFSVENMRVGERADYNRLRLIIATDGSITPSSALRKSSNILQDHFVKISGVEVKEVEASAVAAEEGEEKKAKKASKKKKKEE